MRHTNQALTAVTVAFGALLSATQLPDYDTLISRLENRDPKIRREACKLLGDYGDRRAVPALGKLVKDLDEETRFRAVEAMSSLLDRQSIPFLAEALKDPARRVKSKAIEGLVTLYISTQGPGGIRGLFARTVEMFRRSEEDLVVPPGTDVDSRVIEALAGSIDDPDNEIARDAAKSLGILRARAAAPRMNEVVLFAPTTVKLEILKALQKIRDPEAARNVARLLNTSDAKVRSQAAYTLGLLGAREHSPDIRRLVDRDPDKDVRQTAFEALSLMPSEDMTGWFAGHLTNKNDRLREFAADALGRLPAAVVTGEMKASLRTTHDTDKKARVRLACAFALVAHGDNQFLPELMEALTSAFHRQYGLAYLTELGRDGSRFPVYYPYLKSEKAEIRRYLCDVFANLANPIALEEVKPLTTDANTNVAAAALRAAAVLERYRQ
jgi:HEAT repeat protein